MLIRALVEIAENSDFQKRVNYLMVKAAIAQLNDTPESADILLGQRILDGTEPVLPWAVACVTNPTIAAGAHTDNGSSILDSDLEFTVNSFWTAFKI